VSKACFGVLRKIKRPNQAILKSLFTLKSSFVILNARASTPGEIDAYAISVRNLKCLTSHGGVGEVCRALGENLA
jgi:hypothetical protein